MQAWSRGQRVKRQGAQRTRCRHDAEADGRGRRRGGRPRGASRRDRSGRRRRSSASRRRSRGARGPSRSRRRAPPRRRRRGPRGARSSRRGRRRARRGERGDARVHRRLGGAAEEDDGETALRGEPVEERGEALFRPALGLVGEGRDVGRGEGAVRARPPPRASRAAERRSAVGDGPRGVGDPGHRDARRRDEPEVAEELVLSRGGSRTATGCVRRGERSSPR